MSNVTSLEPYLRERANPVVAERGDGAPVRFQEAFADDRETETALIELLTAAGIHPDNIRSWLDAHNGDKPAADIQLGYVDPASLVLPRLWLGVHDAETVSVHYTPERPGNPPPQPVGYRLHGATYHVALCDGRVEVDFTPDVNLARVCTLAVEHAHALDSARR